MSSRGYGINFELLQYNLNHRKYKNDYLDTQNCWDHQFIALKLISGNAIKHPIKNYCHEQVIKTKFISICSH